MNNMAHKTPSPAVSRTSLGWLLITQFFIAAPLFFVIPLWISAIFAGVALWRWRILQGAWNYPGKTQKVLVVLLVVAGLIFSFGLRYSLEIMLSLLVLGFVLKLLEIKNQKDFKLLIFIAIFLLATQFILFNSLPSVIYGLFCLILLLSSLNTLYLTSPGLPLFKNLRINTLMLLQAVPFMLMFFVVMPRLGSFWAMPSPHQTKTGMSDSMAPGIFNQLLESDDPAFRVTFEGAIPLPDQRYWRSLVFSEFDGKRWAQSREQLTQLKINSLTQKNVEWIKQIEHVGKSVRYSIVVEPTAQSWLYSLAAPVTWDNALLMTSDLVLQNPVPVNQRLRYTMMSALNYRVSAESLSTEEFELNTYLPKKGNLETRKKAAQWLEEAGSTEKLIEKLLAYYNKSFAYTLRPPPLEEDYIDDFLWNKRQGFCEHFSSSFVFFLRAAGIPARVVVGYQGGEVNSVDQYLLVRQRDAHAWAEVWLLGQGWVMVDPTAAVAPERVQKGITESLGASDRQLLARPFGSSFALLRKIRDQVDALNYQWARWVLNYDSGAQQQLFKRIFDDVTPLKIAVFVLTVGAVVMLVIVIGLFLRAPKRISSPSEELFDQLCKRIARCGIYVQVGEAPAQFMQRVIKSRPDLHADLTRLSNLYEQFSYAENHLIEQELKSALRQFSPKKQK